MKMSKGVERMKHLLKMLDLSTEEILEILRAEFEDDEE